MELQTGLGGEKHLKNPLIPTPCREQGQLPVCSKAWTLAGIPRQPRGEQFVPKIPIQPSSSLNIPGITT